MMKKATKQSTVTFLLNFASILLILLTMFSFLLNSYFYQKISTARSNRYQLIVGANLFMSGSSTLTDEVRAYAATGDITYYDNYHTELATTQSREKGLSQMQAVGITGEEQALIDEMSAISNQLVPLEEEAMRLSAEGNQSAALDYVYGPEYVKSIQEIKYLQSEFTACLEQRTENEILQLEARCSTVNIGVGVLILCCIALQIGSSLYTRRRIITPIISIQKEMTAIAGGNLGTEFGLTPDTSEIGLLVGAIHQTKDTMKKYIGDISQKLSEMANRNMDIELDMEYVGDFQPIHNALETILSALNDTLKQVSRSAGQVSDGAEQVANGAQSLAQGATEQASAVERLSSTITDLSSRMDMIAQNADSAKSITDSSADTLNLCKQEMDRLVTAIQEISEASSEIGKIIGTIESIASQTNILALNAAVEAARAGEAGKGFAVVANEVRTLANGSQEASKSTADLISRALGAVEHGTRIVDRTAKTLQQVVENSRQSTHYVTDIAASADAQASALQQLSNGVGQIADVVQTNSATSEESAAAAAQLSTQAVDLQRLMHTFRLKRTL